MPPAPPNFEELAELVPELGELETRTREIRDDGGAFFCANNRWFAIKRRLNQLLGVWRDRSLHPEDAELLEGQAAYETAYDHLYGLLPPCRSCGCERFDPIREEEMREVRPSADAPRRIE